MLKNHFFQMLQGSRSFQLLSAEEQAELKQTYLNASDELLRAAIMELQKDQIASRRIEAEARKAHQKELEAIKEIQQDLKEIEKQELKENVATDEKESQKAASDILATLDEKPKPKKRKKFLGII